MGQFETYELHTYQQDSPADSARDRRGGFGFTTGADDGDHWEVLAIEGRGPVRVGVHPERHALAITQSSDCIAEFRAVNGRPGGLAMLTSRRDVLVNGFPALRMTLLRPKDTLTLLPGVPSFVTIRFHTYVGRPPREMVGQRCPFCKIQLTADSHIARHRCGLGYHLESEATHPDVPESERLSCFTKLSTCLSCGHPMTAHDTLVWEPHL